MKRILAFKGASWRGWGEATVCRRTDVAADCQRVARRHIRNPSRAADPIIDQHTLETQVQRATGTRRLPAWGRRAPLSGAVAPPWCVVVQIHRPFQDTKVPTSPEPPWSGHGRPSRGPRAATLPWRRCYNSVSRPWRPPRAGRPWAAGRPNRVSLQGPPRTRPPAEQLPGA